LNQNASTPSKVCGTHPNRSGVGNQSAGIGAIGDDKGTATFYARSHNRIQLNITQHFGLHLTQILQYSLDERKRKILCQLANPVIKGLIPMFEVQFDIPPVFPQSQQADANIRVMRSDIPLHFRDSFLD
jgi:hypothetical protein